VAGAVEVVVQSEIVDIAVRRLASVADEEDAVDIADPWEVSIRIYRVRNVGSVTREPPSTASVRWRARSTKQGSRSFVLICNYIVMP
jgi:hypothetical protein